MSANHGELQDDLQGILENVELRHGLSLRDSHAMMGTLLAPPRQATQFGRTCEFARPPICGCHGLSLRDSHHGAMMGPVPRPTTTALPILTA